MGLGSTLRRFRLTNNGLSSAGIEVRLTVDGTKCTFIA
jgi:hypothetical protein